MLKNIERKEVDAFEQEMEFRIANLTIAIGAGHIEKEYATGVKRGYEHALAIYREGVEDDTQLLRFVENNPGCTLQHIDEFALLGLIGMKTFGYKDVPTTVWDAVYEKWETALRVGWTPHLWDGCDLCEYVYGHTLFRKVGRLFEIISNKTLCRTCPLYGGWCKDSGSASRLNISFRHPSVPFRSEEAWKERVVEFLNVVKPWTSGGKQ